MMLARFHTPLGLALLCLVPGLALAQDVTPVSPPAEDPAAVAPLAADQTAPSEFEDSVIAPPSNPDVVTLDVAPAVPVEDIPMARASAGLLENGLGAGGYVLVYRTSQMTTDLLTKKRVRFTNTVRFLGADETLLRKATCTLRGESRSILGMQLNQTTTEVYGCATAEIAPDVFSVEVAVPAFKESSFNIGGVSIGVEADVSPEELRAVLHGRMVYDGSIYEARPVGFARETLTGRRVVTGYTIHHDQAYIGRITFDMRNSNKGTLTVPAGIDPRREAVIFLALNLAAMPDLYAPFARDQALGRN